MKRFLISFIITMGIVSHSYAVEKLDNFEKIMACKGDPDCVVCIDTKNESSHISENPLYVCEEELYSYDNANYSLSNNKVFLCPIPTTQAACSEQEYQEFVKESIEIPLMTINISGQYKEPQISFESDTVVHIYQEPVTSWGDQLDIIDENVDLTADMSVYFNDGYSIKDKSIISNTSGYQVMYQLEKTILKYGQVCPLGQEYPCLQSSNNKYVCSYSKCAKGSDLIPDSSSVGPAQPGLNDKDESASISSVNDYINKGEIGTCSMDNVAVAQGVFYSCRQKVKHEYPSGISFPNYLSPNCCAHVNTNEAMRDAIYSGTSTILTIFTGGWGLLGEVFKLFGADSNFVTDIINGTVSSLGGGTCTESEFTLQTLRSSLYNTETSVDGESNSGIITYADIYSNKHNYNYVRKNVSVQDFEVDTNYPWTNRRDLVFLDGNCVSTGQYCSSYVDQCRRFSFLGITIDLSTYGCARRTNTYCCFNDGFEKAIWLAAREQMPDKYGYGLIPSSINMNPCKPQSAEVIPDCSGVSLSDFATLNFKSARFQRDIDLYLDRSMDKAMEQLENNIPTEESVKQDIQNQLNNLIK